MTEPNPAVTAAPPAQPLFTPTVTEVTPAPPRAGAHPLFTWLVLLVGLALPPLLFNENRLETFNRFLTLAILAVGIDLIWGYTGLLSLGQGLFFGVATYCVALSLAMQKAVEETDLPVTQFMIRGGFETEPPELIAPLLNLNVALVAAVVLPTLIAALFALVIFRQGAGQASVPVALLGVALPFALGFGVCRLLGYGIVAGTIVGSVLAALGVGLTSRALARAGLLKATGGRARIQGVYFSLITQALVLIAYNWVETQQGITNGVNGIHELAPLKLAGFTFEKPWHLYCLIAPILVLALALCALLLRSKFGKILTAIRDNENRVLALGYNTSMYKVCAFTLAGALAGVAGALYVPANGHTGVGELSVASSIVMVIWVAMGGRGTLYGAVIGAILVGIAENQLSSSEPEIWPILLGGLFIAVVVFIPKGLYAISGPLGLLGIILAVAWVDPVGKHIKSAVDSVIPSNAFADKALLAWFVKYFASLLRGALVCVFLIGMVVLPGVILWACRRAAWLVRERLGRRGPFELHGQATT